MGPEKVTSGTSDLIARFLRQPLSFGDMARRARSAAGGVVYHVINRGNCRMRIFAKPGDFIAFIKLLQEACDRVPGMRVLAYCLMGNHWHLVLWPTQDTDLAKFVGWISNTHVRRWRQH